MKDVNAKVIALQCPQCGCALEMTVSQIKSPEPIHCSGCGVAIRTDATASSDVTDEIREAAEKDPAEIIIKFVDPKNVDDGA